MTLAFRAMQFAREIHKDQRRKYTGNPYADHLAEVAGIVATVQHEFMVPSGVMLATAWLHDCVEDQGVSLQTIEDQFGSMVAIGVSGLSDVETGNRAERKAASRARLAACSGWIQTIKVADLISNTSSIVMHDPKFAAVYLEEKRLLLDVMTKADWRLVAIARAQAEQPAAPLADNLTQRGVGAVMVTGFRGVGGVEPLPDFYSGQLGKPCGDGSKLTLADLADEAAPVGRAEPESGATVEGFNAARGDLRLGRPAHGGYPGEAA